MAKQEDTLPDDENSDERMQEEAAVAEDELPDIIPVDELDHAQEQQLFEYDEPLFDDIFFDWRDGAYELVNDPDATIHLDLEHNFFPVGTLYDYMGNHILNQIFHDQLNEEEKDAASFGCHESKKN